MKGLISEKQKGMLWFLKENSYYAQNVVDSSSRAGCPLLLSIFFIAIKLLPHMGKS